MKLKVMICGYLLLFFLSCQREKNISTVLIHYDKKIIKIESSGSNNFVKKDYLSQVVLFDTVLFYRKNNDSLLYRIQVLKAIDDSVFISNKENFVSLTYEQLVKASLPINYVTINKENHTPIVKFDSTFNLLVSGNNYEIDITKKATVIYTINKSFFCSSISQTQFYSFQPFGDIKLVYGQTNGLLKEYKSENEISVDRANHFLMIITN